MNRLNRPAFWVPLLSALPVLGMLVLGTAPAQATFTARAAPRFIAIDLGTLGCHSRRARRCHKAARGTYTPVSAVRRARAGPAVMADARWSAAAAARACQCRVVKTSM
jgi:hypothetical protein